MLSLAATRCQYLALSANEDDALKEVGRVKIPKSLGTVLAWPPWRLDVFDGPALPELPLCGERIALQYSQSGRPTVYET